MQVLTTIAMMMIIMPGECVDGKFPIASPVIRRKSQLPATLGYNTYMTNIILQSPCDVIPTTGMSGNIIKPLLYECDVHYEANFINPLKELCPSKGESTTMQQNKRAKTFVFAAAGLISLAVVAIPSIAVGSIALYKVNNVETRQEEINQQINILTKQLMDADDKSDLLSKKFKLLMTNLEKYAEDSVRQTYMIARIVNKLDKSLEILQESCQAWQRKEMSTSFFDYLHFKPPCEMECPVEHGIFHSCEISKNNANLRIDYSLPIVNKNLTIVEADPFKLTKRDGNLTCVYEYIGPKQAILSLQEDCLYALSTEKAPVGLPLASSLTCKPHLSFTEKDDYFKISSCRPSEKDDWQHYTQVKVFDNKYHIYCAGGEYYLGKRKVKCPSYIFTLPLSATFSLNNAEYKGNVLSVVYQQQEDPLYLEQINWHLHPFVNWQTVYTNFSKEEEKIKEKANEREIVQFFSQGGNHILHLLLGMITVLLLIGLFIFITRLIIKKRRGNQPPTDQIPLHEPAQIVINN